MPDSLTEAEKAQYRMFKIRARRPHGRRSSLGLEAVHSGSWRMFQISIMLIWLRLDFRFMTRDAYERYVLSLGPYRNA